MAEQQKLPVIPLAIPDLSGLSLKVDLVNRPANSFQQLDNFDLFVPGSLRKVLPVSLYAGPFTAQLLQLLEYRAEIRYNGGFNRLLGIDILGNLWDINGSTTVPFSTAVKTLLSNPTFMDIPYLGQMQGYYIPYNIRSWRGSTAYSLNDGIVKYSYVDGQLYVFYVTSAGTSGATEPQWPFTGTVSDGGVVWTNGGTVTGTTFIANYGILVTRGRAAVKFVEWKYNPSNTGESPKVTASRLGVSQPTVPLNANPKVSITLPNLNGYAPVSGRAYCWTYYNPNTLKDSSPSPFVGHTKFLNLDLVPPVQQTANGSLIPPIAPPLGVKPASSQGTIAQQGTQGVPYQSYQSICLEIVKSALSVTYGDGYTHIRVWGTKDGGSVFYLINQLFDGGGNQIANSDGSVSMEYLNSVTTVGTYAALPTPQHAQGIIRIFDGASGPVNLAPDPVNLGPAAWAALSGQNQFVVPGAAGDGSGNAAIEYPGPVPSSGPQNFFASTAIVLPSTGTYVFSGWIDKSQATGGFVSWHICGMGGNVIAAFDQADHNASTIVGTFSGTAGQLIRLIAWLGGTPALAAGQMVQWASPLVQFGSSVNPNPPTYPIPDASLVQPAPIALHQQPPPAVCLMGTIFQDSVIIVDQANPSRITYSNTGDFDSFDINSYLQSSGDRVETIMELVPAFERLLVSSTGSIEQLIGNAGGAGFARLPLSPQHGSISYKGGIPYSPDAILLSKQGIYTLTASLITTLEENKNHASSGLAPEYVLSDDVKPLLQSIDSSTLYLDAPSVIGQPVPVIDNNQDFYMLHYYSGGGPFALVMPLRGGSYGMFSRLTNLPGGGFYNWREVFLNTSRQYGVLGLAQDFGVYRLWGGTQDGTVTATAVTQPLPTPANIPPELWDSDKVFQDLILEGNDLPNYVVTASADGGATFPYGPWSVAPGQNLITLGGIEARRLTLKFVHSSAPSVPGITPMLSFLKLTFGILGRRP